jgi:hypothetical protein
MSAINVNSITGRTGSHGPVLTGVTTISGDLHVGSGLSVTGISTLSNTVVGGGLSVTGISTLSNTVVGGATTELVVGGDARITGILTIGTSSVTIDGTSGSSSITGVTTAGITSAYLDSINDLNYPTAGPLSNRNLIINGEMKVAQRGITATTSANVTEYNTVDRWYWNRNSVEELVGIVSQFSDGPSGYVKCWRFTTDNTAESGIESGDRILFYQEVEAQNLQFLEYGQATAKDITCSFHVKSSETGTFGFQIYQSDGNRIIGTTYTINAADTWEYKEITFPGDTGGTINDDIGAGLRFQFTLVAGSDFTGTDNTSWGAYSSPKLCDGHTQNDVVSAVGNYWSVTGCQMEVGTRATPFEHRSYGDELARCQRYFYNHLGTNATADGIGVGAVWQSTQIYVAIHHPVTMRTTPVFSNNISASTPGFIRVFSSGVASWNQTGSTFGTQRCGTNCSMVYLSDFYSNANGTGGSVVTYTAGDAGWLEVYNDDLRMDFDAEI